MRQIGTHNSYRARTQTECCSDNFLFSYNAKLNRLIYWQSSTIKLNSEALRIKTNSLTEVLVWKYPYYCTGVTFRAQLRLQKGRLYQILWIGENLRLDWPFQVWPMGNVQWEGPFNRWGEVPIENLRWNGKSHAATLLEARPKGRSHRGQWTSLPPKSKATRLELVPPKPKFCTHVFFGVVEVSQ